MAGLCVRGVSAHSLICHRCRCGELVVDGFFHQLKVTWDRKNKSARADCPCHECGLVYRRRFRLTSSKNPLRRRLVRWDSVFWFLLKYLPRRWVSRGAGWTLWLEARVPL